MGMFVLLGAEAAHGEGGIGINPDIFEANLINLAIVIGLLFYAGSNFLGKTLSERRQGIETEIQEAEANLKQAEVALAEQQKNVAQAKVEAERILVDAKARAASNRESILAQATQDVERMKSSAAQDLSAEQERAIAELRQRVVDKALAKVKEQLPGRLDEAAQKQLIDRSVAVLGE
ncbi:MAG: F0F1 ATP synthase subunit B [Synechococcales cyanobacterium RM1_1_8]|nr:F0F1 ATP synthase subunit B [Synechococcales cyanobacterium RM1_1_8]